MKSLNNYISEGFFQNVNSSFSSWVETLENKYKKTRQTKWSWQGYDHLVFNNYDEYDIVFDKKNLKIILNRKKGVDETFYAKTIECDLKTAKNIKVITEFPNASWVYEISLATSVDGNKACIYMSACEPDKYQDSLHSLIFEATKIIW